VAGIEAVQPLRELVAVQRVANTPFHLRELVACEQRAQLLVQLDDPLGVVSEFGKNRTLSRWHARLAQKR
jgi:hypothetical protein